MRFISHNPEAEFALHAVRQAALLARHIQDELAPPALLKDDRSPVTVADYAVQAVLSHGLAQAFPADPLVAEEASAALQTPAGALHAGADRVICLPAGSGSHP